MKRFICLALALVLTLGLVACGGSGSANTATEGSKENIKITTPFDLMLGMAILESRVKEGRE